MSEREGQAEERKLRGALTRYRVMAYVVGVWLVLLVLVAMPLKYFAGIPGAVKVAGWVHGILFIFFCMALVHTAVGVVLTVTENNARVIRMSGSAAASRGATSRAA